MSQIDSDRARNILGVLVGRPLDSLALFIDLITVGPHECHDSILQHLDSYLTCLCCSSGGPVGKELRLEKF